MNKLDRPDRQLIYISPLKKCENEQARQLASLVETFMIESAEFLIELTECRTKQIYEKVDELLRGEKNECREL